MTQGLYTWSKTAASNSNADTSINFAEGQAPSSVNDSARAVMARVAEYRDDVSGSLTTAGVATAYTVTTNEVFASLALMDKMTLTVVFNVTSGAAPTLAVDALTAKPLRLTTGVTPPTGCFIAGTPYRFTYYNTAGEFLCDGAVPAAASILGSQIAAGTVANSNLANMAAWTIKVNNTGGAAAPQDVTIDGLTAKATPLAADEFPIWDAAGAAMKKATVTAVAAAVAAAITAPTVQRFTSGSALTYTPSAGMVRIKVRMAAGGGGGGAAATNNGANGSDTSFGTWTAIHGNAGTAGLATGTGGAGGTGGVNGTGTLVVRIAGGAGTGSSDGGSSIQNAGGNGGQNAFGGAGAAGAGIAGGNGAANTGAGGAGGGSTNGVIGSGGGSGETVEFWMTAAQVGASQTYTVGGGGNGGAAGVNAGGNGAAGQIIVEEFYI